MGKANDMHSLAASVVRLGRGFVARPRSRSAEPAQRLELYEFEACPFCRKVRETLTELDLEYVCRSAARGSAKRDDIMQLGGKQLFPFLIDANTDTKMYESEDIIDYLHRTYGGGRSSAFRVVAPFNTFGALIASAVRPRGGRVTSPRTAQPAALLELYNFEASPYCRKVREVLAELDLDYVVHNVGRSSSRRSELIERGGKMMVPYLVDPNTQTQMYESDNIVHHLRSTYG